jgi:hypothetical protein
VSLIHEHWNEGHLTKSPLFVQEATFGVLVPVGKLLGYKAHYPKYSGWEPSSGERAGVQRTQRRLRRGQPL